jgi:hypothetical protein
MNRLDDRQRSPGFRRTRNGGEGVEVAACRNKYCWVEGEISVMGQWPTVIVFLVKHNLPPTRT